MELRSGMWVRVGNRTGIVVRGRGGWDVHLVNLKGETIEVKADVDPRALRQATLAQIPAPRRPPTTPAVQRLGYR